MYILLILMVVIWTVGRLFSYIRLPAVLGEIIAGIIIGPAVLHSFMPDSELIRVLAELGVFFIMFHAGMDTDLKALLKSSKLSVVIASGGIISLFLLGLGVIYWLGFPLMTAIFMGTVLSVTSFPIIARVLKDFKLQNTKIGHAVLGATLVDDIVGFALLSVVITMANLGEISFSAAVIVIMKVLLFFGGTVFLGKKILPYFSRFLNTKGTKAFTFSLIVVFLFGYLAEIIGLHSILGAFIGGVFVKEELVNPKLFAKIEDRYYGIAYSFFGPIFFASIGMAISFSVFQENIFFVLMLLGLVMLGQWIGTGGAAYFFGDFNFREATALTVIASGRGVMEIIIAKIGYDTFIILADGTQQRLLTPDLFSSVVAVSIVVTFLSPFLAKWVLPVSYMESVKQRGLK